VSEQRPKPCTVEWCSLAYHGGGGRSLSGDAGCGLQEDKRNEVRRRGDPKTQTSDARFDERFKLCHELGSLRPWYTQPSYLADRWVSCAPPRNFLKNEDPY
jgi:hypothetical protein